MNRTKATILGLVSVPLVALGLAVPGARANGCSLGPSLVPTCGALWGISVPSPETVAKVTADEQLVGRTFDIVYAFHQIGDVLPTTNERNLVASGHVLHYNIQSKASWASIAAGTYDAQLIRQAVGVASLAVPVFVTFDHEPDVKTSLGILGTASDYVAAWQHVHDLFIANGATNAVWVWVMTGWHLNFPNYPALYPGNAYVDWIGWEAYSTTSCSATKRNPLRGTFADAAGPEYAWLEANGPGFGIDITKPFMIAEYGANYDSAYPSAQGSWYAGIPGYLQTLYPNIKAVAKWDNQGGNCQYQMTDTPSTLQGMITAGQDPYVNPLAP
jgi:hypothetical protein